VQGQTNVWGCEGVLPKFARKKFLGHLCEYFLITTVFGMTSKKTGLHVILQTLAFCFKSKYVGRHFCPHFQGVCPGFCEGFHGFSEILCGFSANQNFSGIS